MSEQKKEVIKTKVGGQALIEGVMMLGPKKGCMAVRQPDREIYTEVWDRNTPKWYNKAPFIRGCINFVSQLGDGYKYLNKSGEVSGMFDEEEDEKDKKSGKYIRRERYAGSMSRSFYVGDGISQKDIHAKYESGILRLTLPKKAPEAIEKENFIAIE